MYAKKKANFDFWLTIWLSFERRFFLETVLQMLLICVCHFSWLFTVTPSRRCFETYSTGVVSKFRFKGSCFFMVFLSRRHQGAFCFRRIQCHPISTTPSRDIINYRPCCKSLRILLMSSLPVLRVPSSEINSHWTDARVRHRSKSLIKMQNGSGPRIDPWGTALVINVYWECECWLSRILYLLGVHLCRDVVEEVVGAAAGEDPVVKLVALGAGKTTRGHDVAILRPAQVAARPRLSVVVGRQAARARPGNPHLIVSIQRPVSHERDSSAWHK